MSGEVEECITHQSESLPSGSISFGRFDLESLSWERRSSFSHNRYLEEVEKYSTPGSVTKKKEYFEAHFKKKALLHQVSVENQNETETKHAESITVDDEVSDEHEVVELQEEEIPSAEFNIGSSAFNCENNTELFNEPLASDAALQSQAGDNGVQLEEGSLCGIVEDETVDANENSKELAENGDAAAKIRETKKKKESIQMNSQRVSMKNSDTVEQKAEKLQIRTHLPTQQMLKKPSKNGNSATYGRLKQNTTAKLEKQIPSKVSSPTSKENGNFKKMAYKNMKAKPSSVIISEEGVRTKKAEVMPRRVERRGSDARQPVNRVKLISKTEDKQTPTAFKLKSSERAEKRKDYYLKLEEKLHAKEAEMNEIQARTEEVKEAEMKQFRKSLNFKATPMPYFYHETATKKSEGKKTSTILSKTPPIQPFHEKPLPSPSPNQEIPSLREPHGSTRLASLSASNAADKAESAETRSHSAKKPDGSKLEEKGKSRMRSGVVGRNVAVHVAS